MYKTKTIFYIVENYYNIKTVEQKAMFTLYKVTVKLMFTLYNNMMKFPKKKRQIIAKCEMSFTYLTRFLAFVIWKNPY